MQRIIACEARPNYLLWVFFEDGTNGEVFLQNVLEAVPSQVWPDETAFKKVEVDRGRGVLVWENYVFLDVDVLHLAIARSSRLPTLNEAIEKQIVAYLEKVLLLARGKVALAARLAGRNRTEFHRLLASKGFTKKKREELLAVKLTTEKQEKRMTVSV